MLTPMLDDNGDSDNDNDDMFQGVGGIKLAQNDDVADAVLKRLGCWHDGKPSER